MPPLGNGRVLGCRGGPLVAAVAVLMATSSASAGRGDDPTQPRERRFMVGLEAVGMQIPALRSPAVNIDPRFVGDTVALGGVGLFGRWRARPIVGFELGVRSGSVRYRGQDDDTVVSQDLILSDAGVLLYLARGDVGQFALDAGIGGIYNRLRYELDDDREGTQQFGSGFVRVGADAEFLVKRIAFVLSLRSYGVFTHRGVVKNRGQLFDQATDAARRAAAPKLQTYVVAAVGIAYRF